MTTMTITHRETGETIELSRSVRDQHPAWVHEQLGTSTEAELQDTLSQYRVSDYYGRDGRHLGADGQGVSLEDVEPCAYCGESISYGEGLREVPDVDDDEAWERLGKAHVRGCEWITTRAHRREDAGV